MHSFLRTLSLATSLGAALTAQSTGRTINTVAPANIGTTAQYAASYPTTAAGNIGWFVMAGHQAGTVPLPIPGFTVSGSCRVNPAVLFQTYLFVLTGSGTSTLSLAVPNSNAFVGFPFDIQTLDADLAAGALAWGDNDVEVVVGSGTQGPLPSANMVAIPAGTFQMGSTAGNANERPVHSVTITQSFWMGKYEVTQAQYQAVMGSNPSYFQGANRPVEQVSWNNAVAYCAALTITERAAGRVPVGYQYRLPTEAEWEYCCRAGTTTEWYPGTSLSTTQANFNGSGQTVNVGSYAANAFGLFDMHGNVWELCLDAWDLSNNYPGSAVTDPYVISGPYRHLRGGSWYDPDFRCRSRYRASPSPGFASSLIGFRVVLAPALVPVVVTMNNFVAIPSGTFQMGSTVGGTEEQPVHQVTITQPFWIGKYEVTQAEYQAVMGSNPSFSQGANLPVEQVSWTDAVVYCTAVTATERAAGRIPTDYQYRLPTEAEWEYCCRAGTTTEWNTGASLSTSQANFNGSATVHVGSYAANSFGLFDMHGNVWEWCLDSWDGSSNYPGSAVYDPCVTSGSDRVLRGGGWLESSDYYCRSAIRGSAFPGVLSGTFGFRVVLAPIVGSVVVPKANFVAIPTGSFQMGSTAGFASEQPVHQVTITQVFWMGKYEVTQAEYQAVMGSNPSMFQGANRPVESISWTNAMAYCAAVTATERAAGRIPNSYQYRLPTEAEWEYCCRAGTTSEWNTGTSLFIYQANFNGISGTVNVGAYGANNFGLFDMHGNVWEWCLDAWDGSNNYPAAGVSDPYVTSGSGRVVRGGAWNSDANFCRSALRSMSSPWLAYDFVGFRVVLAPTLVP